MKITFELNLFCDACSAVFASEPMETPDVIKLSEQAKAKGWVISHVVARAYCPECMAFQKLQTALAAHECR